MGLDQYLHAKRYYSPTWGKDDEKETFYKLVEAVDFGSFLDEEMPSLFMEIKVAQWRKSNQVHEWFVTNIQDGEDNCAEYYVSREQLEMLIALCDEVIADSSKAEDLLPTTSGFFFGSTEYDEWYMNDVKYTSATLKRLIESVPEEWTFYYSSSW
jgi:hypothetical protein